MNWRSAFMGPATQLDRDAAPKRQDGPCRACKRRLGPMKERVTPDGRYFVVRGRLWRRTNPELPVERRATLVRELMNARRAVKAALKSGKPEELQLARKAVDEA